MIHYLTFAALVVLTPFGAHGATLRSATIAGQFQREHPSAAVGAPPVHGKTR